MIQVTITKCEMFKWGEERRAPSYLSSEQWVALRARQKLIDAGIPLGAVVDPWVTAGRLEWWEDRLGMAKVFRWHPDVPA